MNKMAETLFIEILSDQDLRLYDSRKVIALTDDVLEQQLARYPDNCKLILLDSLHVQSKTFTRPVKDKKILDQVIAAEMRDYCLHDTDAYQFSHSDISGTKWVSWIEKSRLAALKKRFAHLQSRIVGLVSLPLLMAAAEGRAGDDNALWEIDGSPLLYALSEGQTAVIHSDQKQAWLQSLTGDSVKTVDLSRSLSSIFQGKQAAALPNLWIATAKSQTTRQYPVAIYAVLAIALLLLWMANAYLHYRQAKTASQSALTAQQDLLHQVYPDAPASADPYGRLSADYHAVSDDIGRQKLWQFNRILGQFSPQLTLLSIDLSAKVIRLQGAIDAALKQSLTDSGFVLQESGSGNNLEVRLSW